MLIDNLNDICRTLSLEKVPNKKWVKRTAESSKKKQRLYEKYLKKVPPKMKKSIKVI